VAEQSGDFSISTRLARSVAASIQNGGDRPRHSPDSAASWEGLYPAPIPSFLLHAGASVRSTDPLSESRDNAVEARKLIVGKGTMLSGEIKSCDLLFVEGRVEAKLKTCQNMVIGETGNFNGTAVMDNAEVRGRYDGDLVVRKRLTIHATGEVTGTISYREIEIEQGGRISGEIRASLADQEI